MKERNEKPNLPIQNENGTYTITIDAKDVREFSEIVTDLDDGA